MSEYALTKRAEAEADLFDIFLFGDEQFGERQAELYAAELGHTFQLLADNPRIGREAEAIALGACLGEVESGSPTRTCANTGIYGVSWSYGITE
jgi:plasmid stabilization system protein ParE